MNANLFDLYFRYVQDTEPPTIFYRWALVAGIGAFLGRRFWLDMGRFRIFPNHYVMLIGDPGTRKNTVIRSVKELLTNAGFTKFSATKTRKEKFLLDLEEGFSELEGAREKETSLLFKNLFGGEGGDDVFGHEPREVMIVAPEFNNFLPLGDLEFLSDLGDLWDWDDEKFFYKYRLKNSKSVHIFQPTISILAGNTHAGFQEMFPPQAIGQGILSRIILVYGEHSGRKVTFPTAGDERIKQEILKTFAAIREKVQGVATLTEDARRAIDLIYRSWKPLEDVRFRHYSSRRLTHLLKLVLICAAARISSKIDVQDVVLASSILTFTEATMPKALGEFGKSKNAEVANKIMQTLYAATRPLKMQDLWKAVSSDLEKFTDLSTLIQNLINADKVQVVPNEGFLPKQRPLDRKALYVDYNLLKEFREP